MDRIINDKEELLNLRKMIFTTGYKGKMAHLASCYSSLEIIYTLYVKHILKLDYQNPKWEERDRFILSKGHAGLALYAVLMKEGLITEKEYKSYLQPNSHIGGEPCMRDCKWIEATTGSLGHGLSMAVGMAIALKMKRSSAKVYILLGDGECEEGSIWEAVMSASAFQLDNIVAILDCNGIQKMDYVEKIIGDAQWKQKWEAFGWNVDDVDGHNIDDIKRILLQPNKVGTPQLVIAHTIKGKGVSVMENNPNWHFRLPSRKELKVFKEELNISDSELE